MRSRSAATTWLELVHARISQPTSSARMTPPATQTYTQRFRCHGRLGAVIAVSCFSVPRTDATAESELESRLSSAIFMARGGRTPCAKSQWLFKSMSCVRRRGRGVSGRRTPDTSRQRPWTIIHAPQLRRPRPGCGLGLRPSANARQAHTNIHPGGSDGQSSSHRTPS
jgi:hypothetical protein